MTSIGQRTFSGRSSLKSVVMPRSIIEMGEGTFEGCTSLKDVILQNGVGSVSKSAFKECTSLKNITIPNSVTSISQSSGNKYYDAFYQYRDFTIHGYKNSYSEKFAKENSIRFEEIKN